MDKPDTSKKEPSQPDALKKIDKKLEFELTDEELDKASGGGQKTPGSPADLDQQCIESWNGPGDG